MNIPQVADYITEWLDGYATRAGLNGFVIGVRSFSI